MLTAVNIITAACALVATWCAVELYWFVRSRSLLVLVAAIAWLAAVRCTVAIGQTIGCEAITENTTYLLAPFWPLLALALGLLLRSLRKFRFNGTSP